MNETSRRGEAPAWATSRAPVRKRIRLHAEAYRGWDAFHVTVATLASHPWFSLHPDLSRRATHLLVELSRARDALLHAWCFMPDHVHLVLQDRDVVGFVRLFKGRLVPAARSLERRRRLWQRSFFDHRLRKDESYWNAAMYVWNNPVRAKLVERAPDYAWSGSLVWPDWREWVVTRDEARPASRGRG